ncbi:MAG TPA: hypothetical protein VGC25_11480 [Alphaproteobacteria bacterium]|jgi:hypothetical protein
MPEKRNRPIAPTNPESDPPAKHEQDADVDVQRLVYDPEYRAKVRDRLNRTRRDRGKTTNRP